MDAQNEDPVEEIKLLRRCINDLISVLALPAIWIGSEPAQVVRTLLGVLQEMLKLDLVYVRLEDAAGGDPITMVQFPQQRSLAVGPQEIGSFLNKCLGDDPQKWPPSVRARIGEVELSIVALRLGLRDVTGVIVAGSQRPDFPGKTEMLLLNVASNQAAIGLQEARLLGEQKRVAGELDRRVGQRTSELAVANEKLAGERAELKRSEARKTAIMDSALDCIITIDHEGGITEFNPASERTFGYCREEVVGKRLADVIIPPALREAHRQGMARFLATEEAKVLGKRMEMTAIRSDGSEFPVELAITRIPFDGPPSFTGYLRDITERKRSEEALRRSEAYLAEAQKLSRTGSFGWSVSTDEHFWSDETFRIFEYEPTTTPTVERVLQRVYPEDTARVRGTIERAAQDGKDFDFEYRLLMPDGSVKHVHVVSRAERDESGKIEFVGSVMDVTAAKEAEAAIRTSAKIAQGLLAFRADVSAALSKPMEAREMLQECAQAMVSHLEAAFARIWTLNHREDLLELQASAGDYTRLDGTHSRIKVGSLKVGLIAREQKPYFTNDVLNDPSIGDKEWARSSGLVSFAGYPLVVDGRTVGVMGMFACHALSDAAIDSLASVAAAIAQGIQRKLAEEALRQGQADLTHVSRVTTLGEFTASIAHEVNQPLTAVINNANACLGLLPESTPELQEVRSALAEIVDDADRASAVIARVRQLARKAPSERTLIDMKDVVTGVLALARYESTIRRVTILPEMPGELPPVLGDRVQLQQVLLNLIVNGMDAMNAVEESRRILVISGQREMRDTGAGCLLGVRDAGVGFEPGEMERLFQAFYTTKPQGMGMGLAISRSIIESHGGHLWAEANEGPGATFLFSLPVARNAAFSPNPS